jgi:SAM-dependent methyltransferase
MTTNRTVKSWDPEWEEIFRRREWGKYPPEHVVRFIARHFYRVPDRSAVRLLDVGCGAGGACTWFMAREGFTASAVDGSPTAVAKAEARLRQEGLTAEFVQSDVISLPWPDATFDAAIDNACLCNNTFENSAAIVREVARVLKPGGWLHSANFTDRCSDYGRGPATEPGGFARREGDGPLSGDYFTRFAGRPHVDALYAPFEHVAVDLESHTVDGMKHFVESWIVTCRKHGATR